MPEETRYLGKPVDVLTDHVLGSSDADITLVEYGSYACPRCRTANQEVARLRDRLGSRLRYVFRHRPLEHNSLARASAELAECAATADQFWLAHAELMTRSAALTTEDLQVVTSDLGLETLPALELQQRRSSASERVDADIASSLESGVSFVPTFFINGVRYDGAWDQHSLAESMLGSLGERVHSAAVGFGGWAPSTALLMGIVTALALVLSNLAWGPDFDQFWNTPIAIGTADNMLSMPLRQWINDGLLSLFFLAVGLEIKREFTVGRLTTRRLAALPIAAALGGMLVPALLYLAIITTSAWRIGAGVPMPTDTAFAVALVVMLGSRVPIELRIFLTAASIVDDIGTIVVVALFYSSGIDVEALLLSAALIAVLIALNRSGIYRPWPYAAVGLLLWISLHAAGLHATLAGVLLALWIPTRPPANLNALLAQAEAVITSESTRTGAALRRGPSPTMLKAIDAIHDRIESPADRLLRTVAPWSSYLVLPLFALANAGLAIHQDIFDGRESLALAIAAGLVIGKPAGFLLASALVIRLGLADRPRSFSLSQIAGAGALAGVGFTMSLFVAEQAFPDADDFDAVKAAILGASVISAAVGCSILFRNGQPADRLPNPSRT